MPPRWKSGGPSTIGSRQASSNTYRRSRISRRFHDAFRYGIDTPEGDIRKAFFLAYDEDNCDYLDLHGELTERVEDGEELVSTSFIIPYPPGFPILVPGQVISPEILEFMRALDVSEIHGYRPDLGLRVFTPDALKDLQKT